MTLRVVGYRTVVKLEIPQWGADVQPNCDLPKLFSKQVNRLFCFLYKTNPALAGGESF